MIWLTLEETARYLEIGKSIIDRLARADDLPAHHVRRGWQFDAEELDERLKSKKTSNTDVSISRSVTHDG